jgi:MFS family permease
MLGFSIGPLVGGAITHFAGWRVIFWFNVALMLIAIAGLAFAGSDTARGTRVGSQAIVAFENGSPNYPIVIGQID